MSVSYDNPPLVDVIGLSKKQCKIAILGDLKYASHENFVGRPITGYHSAARDICLLAPQAAQMLCQAQNYLIHEYSYGIIIYDAYRPLRAVADFAQWFKNPSQNSYEHTRKQIHYPTLNKQQLPELGYVAEKVSRHCFGRAVDLTLIRLDNHQPLDMGTDYDFFDSLSHAHVDRVKIGEIAFTNRKILFSVMEKFGFHVHEKEHWHFDFNLQELDEPLDIEIIPALKNHGVIDSLKNQ